MELYDYQKYAVKFLRNPGNKGLFLKMGLGKTIIVLEYLKQHSLMYGLGKVLILGPKHVVSNVWPNEIKKFGYDIPYYVIKGDDAKRRLTFRNNNCIFLASTDLIPSLVERNYIWEMDILIIDESSMFKDEKSKRFKALKKVMSKMDFKKVIILTGTPTPNSLDEIWTQIYLLDKGERLGTSKLKFMEEYFHGGFRINYFIYMYNKL
jgi:SNF2 family DNA or RNA helicase